jgi:uncharacterized protein YpmS
MSQQQQHRNWFKAAFFILIVCQALFSIFAYQFYLKMTDVQELSAKEFRKIGPLLSKLGKEYSLDRILIHEVLTYRNHSHNPQVGFIMVDQ